MSFWNGRKHQLDRMSFAELVRVFHVYPAVLTYYAILLAALGGVLALGGPGRWTVAVIAAAFVNFSLAWYITHRYILQSDHLYRFRLTSGFWKRVHYDHHCDPNDLRVLFGALATTLPPIFGFAAVAWWLTGDLRHGLTFLATSVWLTIWNEFCHCVEHLPVAPELGFFRRIRKLHRLHHYKNENAYYGITNFWWDHLFGTHPEPADLEASATVHNLGYDQAMAARYPWVRELTEASARRAESEAA